MMLKEISKDIYDVDAWLDEGLGKEGTPEREKTARKRGKSITLKFYWMRVKTQDLRKNRENIKIGEEPGEGSVLHPVTAYP